MPKVVVVYHSGYGHTQRMAKSVAEGAVQATACLQIGRCCRYRLAN